MADKKITINVDNSDENADWIKHVRDANDKKRKEEEESKVNKSDEEEIEEGEVVVDEDEDPMERLNKWINNQRD
tara:strand:+ start:3782 stop:4003 length:222 start_codon:yes stop_codon:yes gene_type:complete